MNREAFMVVPGGVSGPTAAPTYGQGTDATVLEAPGFLMLAWCSPPTLGQGAEGSPPFKM